LISVGDQVLAGNDTIGLQYMRVSNVAYAANSTYVNGNTTYGLANLVISFTSIYTQHTNCVCNTTVNTTLQRWWEFFSMFDNPPGQSQWQQQFGNGAANDEMHVVVVDNGGIFTGTPGEILETYAALSRATDALDLVGEDNYYADVINQDSYFVWWTNDNANAPSTNGVLIASPTTTAPMNYAFTGGVDGPTEKQVAVGDIARAYLQYQSTEDISVNLIITGKGIGGIDGSLLPDYIMDNITEVRKDAVCFMSPSYGDVVSQIFPLQQVINFRNNLRSTSYGMLDSGYKSMYDIYNDVYRWIPLNGDIAGLTAQTELTNDAWWSPAGFNRGQIKNIIKLAYNPKHADRDVLYPAGVNPVVSFPTQGIVLYGDKTLWAKPSAFNRINVRRLFIVLELAIGQMAQYELFEFNDAFTRAQFKAIVNPFLRDIQGRRGVTDFLVICDSTNNPGSVIDRNEFVADMYVKPNRSINFITLRFIAVPTGVQFSEDILGSQIPASALVS